MSRNRVPVALPRELTEEIDALVGQRRRSSFISDAARERLIRHKQVEAIRKFSGSLKDSDYPEWKNGSAEWVHNLRRETQAILDGLLKQSTDQPSSDRRRPRQRRTRETTRMR
jgi:metal-responsive CopG/Arc/MetJ family transcriptional regulator